MSATERPGGMGWPRSDASAAPPRGMRKRGLRARLEEASIALRSMEAVTDPALAILPLDELLDAVLARTKEAVGGDVVAVLLLDERGEEGTVLRVRAAQGAVELAPIGSEVPMGQGIVGMAARWARPVVANDVAAMSDGPTHESARGLASLMAAPLAVQGTVLGMVEVGATGRRTFGDADLRLLQVVADRCAASVERARLDEVARRNRLGAEHANLHLRLLAQGGTVLGAALESYDEAFDDLADVVVPDFADWFSADVLDPSGRLRRVAARGKSRGVILGRAFKDVRNPHPQGDRLVRLAMAERRPQVYARTERLFSEQLDATIHTPASLGVPRAPVSSMMVVPVRVQGAFWGALSFATIPGRRGFRPSDLFTARELAERVGVTVERVAAWRASQRAGRAALHFAERLQQLVEAALVVNAQLAADELLALLVEHARRVLDADAAVVVGRHGEEWAIERSSPGLLRHAPLGGPVPGEGGAQDAGTGVTRIALAAADVVARARTVVRRPDDWPGAAEGTGTAGVDEVLETAGFERQPGWLTRAVEAETLRALGSNRAGREAAEPTPAARAAAEARGWLGVPITGSARDRERVVVVVGRQGARFVAEDESVLTLLAQMASVALQNAGLYATVRTNERRLAAVVDSTPLAIAELRLNGEAQWWNHAATEMFGWHEGEPARRVPVRPGSELVLAGLLESAREGTPVVGVVMPAVAPDGRQVDLSVSVSPLTEAPRPESPAVRLMRRAGRTPLPEPDEAAVTGLLLVAEDVTERRRLLDQFHQAERLSAMTRMAGAVAHDFNNLLTVILGCSDVISRRLPEGSELTQDVDAIQRAGTRASQLTGQLVRIGQQHAFQPEVVDVDEVVHAMTPMVAGVLGESVTLEVDAHTAAPAPGANGAAKSRSKKRGAAAGPGRILVDRSELERSILNLAINARDAMPEGGTLTVRTGSLAGSRPERPQGVVLTVADTGSGMDDQTLAHCFEPFFTTKGRAQGTGLGLATVHATVTQAGGEVTVESAPGEGTRFALWFPAYEGPDRPAGAEPAEAPEASPRRAEGQTLLVVDDEAQVLRLEVRELVASGYEVLSASNATEALQALDARGGAVDLLVTDVVMPGMNGIELAAAVRHRAPRARVLFVSGHLDDEAAEHGPLPGDAGLLTKPFRPDELSRAVREILHHPRGTRAAARPARARP